MQEHDIPVIETYAEAFIDAAERGNLDFDVLLEECTTLGAIIEKEPNLMRLLERPAIRKDDKQAFLKRVFGGKVQPLLLSLSHLLVEKNRGGLWGLILGKIAELIERKKGIFPCRVETAVSLSEAEKNDLRRSLENYTKKQLHIDYHLSPALIGGVLVRYGDLMIDTSLRSNLKELREKLEAIDIH